MAKFPDVKTVIIHSSAADMEGGNTESIKKEYHLLNIAVSGYKAKLVLLSPIATPNLSNRAFSRMVTVENWFFNLKKQKNLFIIDNTNFWNETSLFDFRSETLNTAGADLLARNILKSVDL